MRGGERCRWGRLDAHALRCNGTEAAHQIKSKKALKYSRHPLRQSDDGVVKGEGENTDAVYLDCLLTGCEDCCGLAPACWRETGWCTH